MRKSTLIMMTIVAVALTGMAVLMDSYVGHLKPELETAKALTSAFRADLEERTKVRVTRVARGTGFDTPDAEKPGLVIDATPSARAWERDRSGLALGRSFAERVFASYGSDRPIYWAEVRLERPGSEPAAMAFGRPEGLAGPAPLAPRVPKPGPARPAPPAPPPPAKPPASAPAK